MSIDKIEIKAPWGNITHDFNNPSESNEVVFVKHVLKQLKYFRDVQGNKTEKLAVDIKGYEEILNSKDPEYNAGKFMEMKDDFRTSQLDCGGNLNIIKELKKRGFWRY